MKMAMRTLPKSPSASQMAVRTAIILFLFVVVFTGFLSGAYLSTQEAISAAANIEKMNLINEVLPPSYYDKSHDLLADTQIIPPTPALGLSSESRIYRARQDKKINAVVLESVALDGYSGKIHLLIAIAKDGRVLGVRVTQHKETPGLGDYIDIKKDRNKTRPWISQFNGLTVHNDAASARAWQVKKDGGNFDSVTGATVSPRAVIKAVHKAALYVLENHEFLFDNEENP